MSLSLQTPRGRESSDFQIRFLAGGATQEGIVIFHADPSQGRLTVDPISYVRP